jgi:CheY-like chemotaxis protein
MVSDVNETWISWSFSSEPRSSLLFVSARCVTEEKQGQQALQEARIKEEEASRAKTDFLAVMSHELRTPLNPILGFTDILMEDAESEEQKEILNTIIESGNHMLALVDEILEYAKLDAGKAELEPVEDNKSNALYIEALIGMSGAEVVMVEAGELALEQLRERAFDLVVLDLHMPGIGGLETLKRIRSSESRSTPVFILTADASVKAKTECQQHGADGFLVKPVGVSDIKELLGKYLKKV